MIRAILVGGTVLAAWYLFRDKSVQHQLNELGLVTLPKRLEARRTRETPGSARFKFERDAGSFRLIGAPHTIAERLAIGVWKPETHADTKKETIWLTQDSVDSKSLRWRVENGFEIGEGLYQTGVDARPAYVIVKEHPVHQITVAYMSWQSGTSLKHARQLVDSVIASYQPARAVDDYLKIAADRPARLKAERHAAIHQFLKSKGIQPELDGDFVAQDGVLYALYTHHFWGRLFATVLPLGDMQPLPRYLSNIQWSGMVLWFTKEPNTWEQHALHDETPNLPASFSRYLDAHALPGRANFFAVHVDLLDDIEAAAPVPDFIPSQAAKLRRQFATGAWIKPWD